MIRRLLPCLLVCACSSESAPPAAGSASASASASANKAPAADAGAKPEPAKKPESVKSSVTFNSSKIPNTDFSLAHVEATQHKMKDAGGYVALIIDFANYDRGGGAYLPDPNKEGHVRVRLNFSAPTAPTTGSYPVDAALAKANKLSVGIQNKWHSIGLVKGSGQGEITSIDDTTVQGKVSVKDDQGTSIEATFSVPYTVGTPHTPGTAAK